MKFDFETIKNFDEHILKSIPNYDILFDSIVRLSRYFIVDNYMVYDIGCSTANLLFELSKLYPNVKKIGIEKSVNLLPSKYPEDMALLLRDLNDGIELEPSCLVFSIFTLQFLNRSIRQHIINEVYDKLCVGGALIIAEKTYANNAAIQDMFTFTYYDFKKSKFTEKEILDKEKDLRSILRPNTSDVNLSMLKQAGFKKIDRFYKYFMFEGYVCIK